MRAPEPFADLTLVNVELQQEAVALDASNGLLRQPEALRDPSWIRRCHDRLPAGWN